MMRFAKIEKIAARVAVKALALVSLLSVTAGTRAQDAERPYPTMLPFSQYLMDRDAAIALARSAAPEGISKDASVLVLTPKGWETAVKGSNGFVCMAGHKNLLVTPTLRSIKQRNTHAVASAATAA